MAGLYADVPGVRIPYHVDGTLVRWADTTNSSRTVTGSWTSHSGTDTGKLNDGDISATAFTHSVGAAGRLVAFVFPAPIAAITGHNIYMSVGGGTGPTIQPMDYSTDTIDGGDGTWTTTPIDNDSSQNTASMRTGISTVNWSNIKGIRIWITVSTGTTVGTYRDVAFYGTWAPAMLTGWHPTLDQQIPAAHLDYGDIAQGAVVVKQFRIKNGRPFTANGVVVSAPIGNTQTIAGLTFSLDNSTYSTSVTTPPIASGAISPVVYVKRTVGIAEALGNVGIAPIQFVATSWT